MRLPFSASSRLPPAPPSPPRTCIRCSRSRPPTHFPPTPPTSYCDHPPTICWPCLFAYAFAHGRDEWPTCPQPGCDCFLAPGDMERVIDRERETRLGGNMEGESGKTVDVYEVSESGPARAGGGSAGDRTYAHSSTSSTPPDPPLPPKPPSPATTRCSCAVCLRQAGSASPVPTDSPIAALSPPLPPRPVPAPTPALSPPLPPRPPPPAITRRSCVVCLDKLYLTDFPPLPPTSACTHDPTTCTACLRQHVRSAIQSGNLAIACPTCSAALEYNNVRECVDREDFERYDALLLRQSLSGTQEFVWCLNASCGAGQMHGSQDGGEEPIVTCPSCGSKSCFVHAVPWHTGLSCEAYDVLQRQTSQQADGADQDFLRQHTKSCPSCHAPIQKNEGCEHMTYEPPGGCGHQFCWLCLVDWKVITEEGNHMHRSDCAFWIAMYGVDSNEEEATA